MITDAATKSVTKDGVKLAYLDAGAGVSPPLVLREPRHERVAVQRSGRMLCLKMTVLPARPEALEGWAE